MLLGAHWFTDVAVGWITSAGWLSLLITTHRLYLTTVNRPAVQTPGPGSGPIIMKTEL